LKKKEDGQGVAERGGKPENDLLAAHARFARAAMGIYLGTAGIAICLLVATLTLDRSQQKASDRDTLLLENQVRAHALGRHLELLAREINRLGLRSEVDLLDNNMEPERSLLRLTHERSAFFNVGVAILSGAGEVMWSEPQTFLAKGLSAQDRKLLEDLRKVRSAQIYPAALDGTTASVVYVASPVLRGGQFTGALIGAIDLASGRTLEGPGAGTSVALATRTGDVIFPPGSPPFAVEPAWKQVPWAETAPFVRQVPLLGKPVVVAGAPVDGTDFVLLSLAEAPALYAPAETRFRTRLILALLLSAVPICLLVFMLRRSLLVFRKSEQEALEGERLRSLGEAADLIAHEVKNSLNGIRVGVDLLLRGSSERQNIRAVDGLRSEIERLTRFTSELLAVSRGVQPRPTRLDLCTFLEKVTHLYHDRAESQGTTIEASIPEAPVYVRADPTLVHVVIANLLGNALDFLDGKGDGRPLVRVRLDTGDKTARVEVVDNGPGVAEAVRRNLFQPFVTGKPSGVGIGLSYSRRIARAHGGDLVLVPAHVGATFLLTLPLEAQ
jgi:two-component system C4-dicarboxylate transport sensor histidine kinase DctB